MNRVFVVGGASTPFLGKGRPDFVRGQQPTLEEQLGLGLRACFEATGVDPSLVDRAWLSNFLGELFAKQGHASALFPTVEPLLDGVPAVRVEAACASGGFAVTSAFDAMQTPWVDVALVAGVEVENTVRGRDGVEYMAYAAHMGRQRGTEFALFPWFFARRAKAWKELANQDETVLAEVVKRAYAGAAKNPLALHHHHAPVGVNEVLNSDTFLSDEALHDHIRLMHCTAFTDGASAAILATEAGLEKLGIHPDDCTEILGYGQSVAALGAETDPARMPNMARAAAQAYERAGLDPAAIDVAEVHDCFAAAWLQVVEALGLTDEGRGHTVELPVNSGGGLLGFGHPIGATGVKQVIEVHNQLKRKAGPYQAAGELTHGISANLGGDDRTGVVIVQRG